MAMLIAGIVLFFAIHSVAIVAPGWRDTIAARLGGGTWRALYAIAAIAGFVLMVWGYSIARQSPVLVYQPPVGLRHLTAVLMLPVFPLLLAAYLPGRIRTATKHPMLAATKLWAFAHLLANGTMGDVLLFGSFLIWAVADRISFRNRAQRPIPGASPSKLNDWIAVIGGLGMYVFFVAWAHVLLFGVAPLG